MRRSARFFLGVFLLAALIGFSNFPAAAQRLRPDTVCEKFARCPVVFVGLVVGAKFQEKSPFPDDNKEIHDVGEVYLLVEEAFRGVEVGQRMTVHSAKYSDPHPGMGFRRSERYLVYGEINEKTGEIRASRGIWTRILDFNPDNREQEQQELAALRELAAAPEGATVSGKVLDRAKGHSAKYRSQFGLPGVTVTIKNADGFSYKGETDAKGFFEIQGVKAGEYSVRYNLPEGYRLWNSWEHRAFKVLDRGCFSLDEMDAYSSGSISGWVEGASGNPFWLTDAQLTLVRCDADGKPEETMDRLLPARLSEDGRFCFSKIPEGNYLLQFGLGNRATLAVWPTYWPDPQEPTRLRVIRVDVGENIELERILAPEWLVSRILTGVVRDFEGKPVVGCAVMLFRMDSPDGKLEAEVETDADGRFIVTGRTAFPYVIHAGAYIVDSETCTAVEGTCRREVPSGKDAGKFVLRLTPIPVKPEK